MDGELGNKGARARLPLPGYSANAAEAKALEAGAAEAGAAEVGVARQG